MIKQALGERIGKLLGGIDERIQINNDTVFSNKEKLIEEEDN